MPTIIGVRFREAGRVYYFNPGDYTVQKGDKVIVETARGVECGEVMQESTDLPEEQLKHPLKEMLRMATPEDIRTAEGKAEKEAEAFSVCEEKILKHGLDMKLVNVEYNFEGTKIVFHFTADQRVDFRALVRDLAGVFRTRIELRQIGVRDEAKLLGGLGICGRPFCCSQFLGDFHPVSIKMAKEQGLSLNPTKISGTCGRLMCCLKYEEAAYEDALKNLPKVGTSINTPEGRGVVTEVNAISSNIKVRLERRSDAAPMVFQYDAKEGARRKAPSNFTMPAEDSVNPPNESSQAAASHSPRGRAPGRIREPLRGGLPVTPPLEQTAENRQRGTGIDQPVSGQSSEKAVPEALLSGQKQPQKQRQRQNQQKRKQHDGDRTAAHSNNSAGKHRSAPEAAAKSPDGYETGRGAISPKPVHASPFASGNHPSNGKNNRNPAPTAAQPAKNWRERHSPPQGKPAQPAYRQQRPASPPSPLQSAPLYSEIPSPRRALAPKPESDNKKQGQQHEQQSRRPKRRKKGDKGTDVQG